LKSPKEIWRVQEGPKILLRVLIFALEEYNYGNAVDEKL